MAGGEVTTQQLVGAFRAIEAYDPLTNSWSKLPPMPMPRHGAAGAVIGNRFYLVSGMIQSAGALVFLDPTLATHTVNHDILDLPQFNPAPPTAAAKSAASAPSETSTGAASIVKVSVPATNAAAPSDGAKKVYTRYNVNSPEGQVMLAKYARAVEIMRTLPDYDQHSWNLVVVYPLDQRLPRLPVGFVGKEEGGGHRHTSEGVSEPTPRPCGTAARPTRPTLRTRSISSSGSSCRGTD